MTNNATNSEKHVMLKVEKIVEECNNTKTFYFKHKLNAKPGQFVLTFMFVFTLFWNCICLNYMMNY